MTVLATSKMARGTVLIGFAEALSAPEVAWSLVDHGFEVIAFCRSGKRAALQGSRYVTVVPITAPDQSVSKSLVDLRNLLASLGRRESQGRLVLMPLDDAALWLSKELGKHESTVFCGPDPAKLEVALDKWLQVQRAVDAGFAVPETICVSSYCEASSIKFTFPVVVKPRWAVKELDGRLHRGEVRICSDQVELERALGQSSDAMPMLVQEYVEGSGEGLFGIATADGVKGWSAHRRLRMMNPQGSGSSACTAIAVEPQFRKAAEKFVESSEWRGLFMLEMLRDSVGKGWFMEFNGRSWGSMALARRRGLEYPAWNVQASLGVPVSICLRRDELEVPLVCRHLGRELLHLAYVIRGAKTNAAIKWPSVWGTVRAVCRMRRNDRWYNWRADDVSVFVRDCVCTLRDQWKARRRKS